MEGVKIELKDRRGQRMNKIRREHEEQRYFYKDGCRYSFRFDKPHKKQIKDTVLKIKTLELPKDIETFNSGTSLDRWAKKRPRLKSSILQRKTRIEESSDDEDNLDTIREEVFLRDDDFYEEPNENTIEIEKNDIYEIDSNVQQLIEKATECKDINDENLDRKRFRRKLKEDKRLRRKGRRKISIVLSKPPSPQTVQVIRVDVTSNYSYDNAESSEEDDYCERFQNIVDEKEEDEKEKSLEQDFTVMCRKLTISARERKIETKTPEKSA